MFCRFCGKEILDDSKFCQYCGSLVNEICDTDKVTTRQTQSIDYVLSNMPNEPFKIELVKAKINKPKFNIKFSWEKCKSIFAKEIVFNVKLLGVAIVLTLLYLLGFRIYHHKDIQKVYITPIDKSVYDKQIYEHSKSAYSETRSAINFLRKHERGENEDLKETYELFYRSGKYAEELASAEYSVYKYRKKYFKSDLATHAQHASWISVVVLILGRYFILIIKHYIIPFVKWIIKNGNK